MEVRGSSRGTENWAAGAELHLRLGQPLAGEGGVEGVLVKSAHIYLSVYTCSADSLGDSS